MDIKQDIGPGAGEYLDAIFFAEIVALELAIARVETCAHGSSEDERSVAESGQEC